MTQSAQSHAPRVLLAGYYGKCNFGDDVLLTVTHRLLRQVMPAAHFSVIVDGDAGGYVSTMLQNVTVLKSGRHGHFDMIIHGGGGVFFDFQIHSFLNKLAEQLLHICGYRAFLAAERALRIIVNKQRTSATRRIGLGIGAGGFSFGSPKLRHSLPIFADFDALWLRDAESFEHLKPFASVMRAPLIAGSDLAFLTQYWLPVVDKKPTNARPRLGVILRDWPVEEGGVSAVALRDILAQLSQDYDIMRFIFDQHADPEMQQLLAPYTTIIWRPETMSIADFSQYLSAQDLLLTSRAHGAICGACLGVPSVIVAIEPKLEQVAAMLPNASVVVSTTQTDTWPEAIRRACAISPDAIAGDVKKNRAASQAAFDTIKEWFI